MSQTRRSVILAAVLTIFAFVKCDEDVIKLKQGRIRGHRLTTRNGREIFAFQGIPYAQPPIGELRFKPPQPVQPWQGILDATKDSSVCVQRNFFNLDDDLQGEEDCLYINVFTPQKPGTTKKEVLDVMFWIHGGGWVSGSGGISMYGPQFLLDKDVVLVTINYRLGAFGFLSTGDALCPGNNGLKDQVAALRWVRDNIAAFGGNPNSVTIFGESAGAASVHYLMLSPSSRGLFHRSISQSGTALLNWASAPNGSTVHHARKLASLVGCPVNPSSVLLSCLKSKDVQEIASTDKEFVTWDTDPLTPFNVVIETDVGEDDEAFLSIDPEETVRTSSSLVPWMVGLNAQDGALDTVRILRNASLIKDLDDRFDELLPIMFFIRETASPAYVVNISQQIRNFYFQDHHFARERVSNITNMFTDGFIFSGTDQAVKLHSQKTSPIYYYLFDYRGTHSYSSMFGDFERDYGVVHQDELLYLFPEDHLFPNATRSQDDDKMVDFLTTLWTNFARTGNPTPESSELQAWNPISSPDILEYAHIKGDGLHMERNLFKERADFWASLPIHSKTSTTPRHEF